VLKVDIESVPSKVTDLLRKCNPHTMASRRQCTTHTVLSPPITWPPLAQEPSSSFATFLACCRAPRLLTRPPKAASLVPRRNRSGRSTNSFPILPTTDTDRLNDRFRYGWLFSFAD